MKVVWALLGRHVAKVGFRWFLFEGNACDAIYSLILYHLENKEFQFPETYFLDSMFNILEDYVIRSMGCCLKRSFYRPGQLRRLSCSWRMGIPTATCRATRSPGRSKCRCIWDLGDRDGRASHGESAVRANGGNVGNVDNDIG